MISAMDNPLAPRGRRIGELAKLLGTTTKTLRYYEEVGLLGPVHRNESAYRLYDDDAVENARLVLGLRHLELTIPELHDLMRADDKATRRQRLLALMDDKLRRIYLDLAIVQGRCDDLAARHSALLATPRDRPPHCVCDALMQPCNCRPKRAGAGDCTAAGRERNRLTLPQRHS